MTYPDGNYWYAEPDDHEPPQWQAVLQMNGMCLSSEIFFQTAADCEEFIRDDILPATAHFAHGSDAPDPEPDGGRPLLHDPDRTMR